MQHYERLLVTTWGHDPGVIASSNILLTLNDALAHSAVFVQVQLPVDFAFVVSATSVSVWLL